MYRFVLSLTVLMMASSSFAAVDVARDAAKDAKRDREEQRVAPREDQMTFGKANARPEVIDAANDVKRKSLTDRSCDSACKTTADTVEQIARNPEQLGLDAASAEASQAMILDIRERAKNEPLKQAEDEALAKIKTTEDELNVKCRL